MILKKSPSLISIWGRGLRWLGAKKLWSFPQHILRSEKGQRSQIYGGGPWDFSVSPRPLGIWYLGLGLRGMGPGLDNFLIERAPHMSSCSHLFQGSFQNTRSKWVGSVAAQDSASDGSTLHDSLMPENLNTIYGIPIWLDKNTDTRNCIDNSGEGKTILINQI